MKKIGKQGFTIIELMISFSLTVVIVIYLFNVIIILKNLYTENGIKTQMLISQSSITKSVETVLSEGPVLGVASCGANCVEFTAADSSTHILQFDPFTGIMTFDSATVKWIDGSKMKALVVEEQTITELTTGTPQINDSILKISIPITHKVTDGEFNINIVIPYNSRSTSVTII